ncbi:response regulator [Microbacterium sp. G2-8]|uniref:response regulator n=1 Tax=Microbacterium sp. G2-8 TaxID=2842454 RepID=UPI001C8931C2|nr:response regulator [Microbacterium sp. G2-8]
MALARLHRGPLDGQVIPLEDLEEQRLIIPYSASQLVYARAGELTNTGPDDGPTEAQFWYVEGEDDLVPHGDD